MNTKKFLELVKEKLGDNEIRFCSCCGKAFIEGFYAAGEYYCDENCLLFSSEEWKELYNEDEDEYYWSQWEGDSKVVEAYNELLWRKN